MSAEDRTLSDPFAKIETASPAHVWTEQEDSYLRENHDGTTARMRLIGDALGMPWFAVKARAAELHLTNPDETQPNGSHGLKRVKVEHQPPELTRICKTCGESFVVRSRNSPQRFCSRACSNKIPRNPGKSQIEEAPAETADETPPPYELTIVPKPLPTPQPPKAVTYMVFADLVELLPESRTWTSAERQRWLRMFVGVLDYVITVEEG